MDFSYGQGMRLEMSFRFDTGASSLIQRTEGRSMSDANEFRDFAAHLAGSLKKKHDEDRDKRQKALQDMSVLKLGFGALCDGAYKSMLRLIEAVNNNPNVGVHLVCTPNSAGYVIARSDVAQSLQVSANPELLKITFKVVHGKEYERTYQPKLSESQTDSYFVDEFGVATTVQEMCMQAIAEYLGVPPSGS